MCRYICFRRTMAKNYVNIIRAKESTFSYIAATWPREFPPFLMTSITSEQSEFTSIRLHLILLASGSPSCNAIASAVDGSSYLILDQVDTQCPPKHTPSFWRRVTTGSGKPRMWLSSNMRSKTNMISHMVFLYLMSSWAPYELWSYHLRGESKLSGIKE
jgi:hypothetical protein